MESGGTDQDKEKIESGVRARVDESAGKARIWVFGETGGGTVYSGSEYLMGVYRMLKGLDDSKLPDVLIFNGVLPEIPKYGTKGGRDRLLELESGVNVPDDAVIAVKQDLGRIMALVAKRKPRAEVHYFMGYADKENIKSRNYDRLVNAYKYAPDNIGEIKNSYLEKVRIDQLIVDTVSRQVKLKEKALQKLKSPGFWDRASDARAAKAEHRLELLKEKLTRQKDEIADYNELADIYTKLQMLWIKEHPDTSLEDIISAFGSKSGEQEDTPLHDLYTSMHGRPDMKDLSAKYKKLSKELDGTSEVAEPSKFAKLESKVKVLANLLEKYGYREIDEEKARATVRATRVFEEGEVFTHNVTGSRDLAELADRISRMEIALHVKDAFGRFHPVSIVQENFADIMMVGKSIRVMGNPTNVSNSFKKDAARKAERMLAVGKSGADIDIIIGGHSAVGEIKAVAATDKGSGVFEIIAPPLVDVAALGALWSRKVKTTFTQMYEHSSNMVSSGFWEITLNKLRPEFTYHTSEELGELAEAERAEQVKVLVKKLDSVRPEKEEVYMDSKDVLKIRHALPSELSKELVTKLVICNGINPKAKESVAELAASIVKEGSYMHLKPYDALSYSGRTSSARSSFTLDMKGVSDTHIGTPGEGMPAQSLLRAYVNYEMSGRKAGSEPMTLLLLGDLIDGGYNNYNMEKGVDWNINNIHLFENFLRQNGVKEDSKKFENEMTKYKAYMFEKLPIYNVEDQRAELIYPLVPLLKEASAVVVTGGNHFNKEARDRKRDETTALVSAIGPYVESNRIIAMFGGDYGIGHGHIDQVGIFATHKASPKVFTDMRITDPIAVAGDDHVFRIQVVGNKALFTVPQVSCTGAFPAQINIPTSRDLRGFMDVNAEFYSKDGNGEVRIKSFTAMPVFENMLRRENFIKDARSPLISSFEKGLNSVSTAPTPESKAERQRSTT